MALCNVCGKILSIDPLFLTQMGEFFGLASTSSQGGHTHTHTHPSLPLHTHTSICTSKLKIASGWTEIRAYNAFDLSGKMALGNEGLMGSGFRPIHCPCAKNQVESATNLTSRRCRIYIYIYIYIGIYNIGFTIYNLHNI